MAGPDRPGEFAADELSSRLSALVQSSDDAIVSKTLDGIITSWNHSAERIFGWTAAEAIGRHITLIIPPERHAEEDDILARLRRGELIDHFETVRLRKDGRHIDVSISVSPIRDGSGRIIGASKIARSLADRRQGEVIQARLAAIIESSDDAIVSKTLDGVITSWNRAAERIFGWTPAEAVGRHITLIIPTDRHAEEDDVIRRIRRGERVDHFDTVRVRKDGTRVDVSVTVSPIRDGTGRVVGASKIARDIGDRRRLEEERARMLAREQEARQQAEALSRSKDELLATVSHELRTPLNAIFGWARMLQTANLDEAQKVRAINAIVRSASAQARLVEDLLDLSRVVTGRMRLDVQTVHLNLVIEAALEALRPAISAKDIALVTALDSQLGTILGAPDRLQQVVWNVVMNAVKFTPRGGRVEVRTRCYDDSVELVVSDTGEGIAPELLPHVFEPFRQEDSSSTRAHGGLGLGLTLVRQLIEVHGGSVRADSAGKGQGTTITIVLPLASARAAGERGAGDADGRALRGALHGVRVLLVDDDTESLEVTTAVLRDKGAEVRAVASAFRAHEMVETWQPDVVLTDLAMPGEDGFMLVRALRTVFARRGVTVPMIAVTAYGSPESQARAIEAGFDLYLTKPIDPLQLASAVGTVAQRAS
jgi:PAS domain S-box-containing protein